MPAASNTTKKGPTGQLGGNRTTPLNNDDLGDRTMLDIHATAGQPSCQPEQARPAMTSTDAPHPLSDAPVEALSVQPKAVDEPRAYRQTGPCPVWCDTDHDGQFHPDERIHYSKWDTSVVCSLEPPEIFQRNGELDADPCEIEVYVHQPVLEAAPKIHMGEQVGRQFTLTLAEAEQLGRALLQAVETAGGVQ